MKGKVINLLTMLTAAPSNNVLEKSGHGEYTEHYEHNSSTLWNPFLT